MASSTRRAAAALSASPARARRRATLARRGPPGPQRETEIDRRRWLVACAALPWPAAAEAFAARQGPATADPQAFAARLAAGGVVVAFRHAQAPGQFDPPGFVLGDCRTQRNLDDAGRDQARRIGAWFEARGLRPAAVRSSPWCRCLDTARLAFGAAQAWAALGSPRAGSEATQARALAEIRDALLAARRRPGFEAWVTHQFLISALVGRGAASGEGLLLQGQADGPPRVLARLSLPAR